MKGLIRAAMVYLIGYTLASRIFFIDTKGNFGYRLIILLLFAAILGMTAWFGSKTKQYCDREEAGLTRRFNMDAFLALGIPEKAVHTITDSPRHFFGMAIDKEQWLLYLLESRNAKESADAPQRMMIFSFSDIDEIDSSFKQRSTTASYLTGSSQTYGYTKNDVYHGHTQHYKYETVRHHVGHVLHLHMNSKDTISYHLSPSKKPFRSYDAEKIIKKLQDALDAYRRIYPKEQEKAIQKPEYSPYLM